MNDEKELTSEHFLKPNVQCISCELASPAPPQRSVPVNVRGMICAFRIAAGQVRCKYVASGSNSVATCGKRGGG